MKPTLLILAAWMGSRYGWIKQLDTFWPHGETLLEYAVYDAVRAWFGKVVFIIREEFAQEFKERFHETFARLLEVQYVFQQIPEWRTKPWGTGHAILCAKDVISEPFAVINADDYYGVDGFRQIAQKLMTVDEHHMCMVGYTLKNTLSEGGTVNRWVCHIGDSTQWSMILASVKECLKIKRDDDGIIRDEEGVMFADDEIVSMNFRWCHPALFAHLEEQFQEFLAGIQWGSSQEFFIPTVIDTLINRGDVQCDVLVSKDIRCGVTYKEDKPFVEALIAKLVAEWVYPEYLRSDL